MPTSGTDEHVAATELAITGMTCGGCVQAVTRVLTRVPGVSNVRVDLSSERAWVSGTASAAQLEAAVRDAGYGAQQLPR